MKRLRVRLAVTVVDRLVGDQRVVVPERHAVARASSSRAPSAAATRPGYHLPCPKCSRPPGREPLLQAPQQRHRPARASSGRARRCSTRRRPCRRSRRTSARRPSSAARRRPRARASTRWPSASIRCHCSSVYGLVTRGDSWIRRTRISCSNSTSHSSTAPVIGAALNGSGVAASGMWPSPASRPEVGSSPTQPGARADTPRPRRAGR